MTGRELDMMVAQQVLGYSVTQERDGTLWECTTQGVVRPLRAYSTDIGAAWEVVERMRVTLIPIDDGTWFGLVGGGSGWRSPRDFIQYLQAENFSDAGAAVSTTAPLTICLAALKAMENRPEATVPLVDEGSSLPH